ncbi:DUF58 domain-containing protein [Natronobacterium texcoconense]|uniref:Conserved repeat domain-containing protein n=1 Tax=Natronobacterium texcoconense TaxID=1095778 RepID=A0A1H1FG02_NATTX|nr:DUF58 domain-containing protein [Natronobacterium texcoconense]SDQ99754.1 conserved repeat domain-containing protein [Natronobacterium texcoconense]
MTLRRTVRWNVPLVAGLFAAGVGVFFEEPTTLLLAVPAFVFAAYGHLAPKSGTTLEIERTVSADHPAHGETVEVTTTVRNAGRRPVFDLRVVDGVPRLLSVEDGSARHTAVLGPDEETTFSYTVVATHGVHRFEPASVLVRDLAGGTEVADSLETETVLACQPTVRTLPTDRAMRRRHGSSTPIETDDGLEFAAVREYRRGDPVNRIDWNRYARSGTLSTVRFRDERSRSIVLCLDARTQSYHAAGSDEPHAVACEVAAARAVIDAIEKRDEPIGAAVLGPKFEWIPPGSAHHVATVRRALELETDGIVPVDPPSSNRRSEAAPFDEQVRTVGGRLARKADVVLFSPLLDDDPIDATRTLESAGCSVAVLSPDVTTDRSLGTELARLQRDNRIGSLRRSGTDVIDWRPDRSLEMAIQRGIRP